MERGKIRKRMEKATFSIPSQGHAEEAQTYKTKQMDQNTIGKCIVTGCGIKEAADRWPQLMIVITRYAKASITHIARRGLSIPV